MYCEEVAFVEGTPVGIRASEIRDYPPHWHDQILEVVFVLRGRINLITSFENFAVEAGEFVLINQGEIHHIHGDGDNTVISLYIDLRSFEQYYENIGYIYFSWETFNPGNQQIQDSFRLKKLFLVLMLELGRKRDGCADTVNRMIRKIVDLLIYRFDIAHYYNDRNIPREQLHKYHDIVRYLEENYAEKITMEDLAKEEYMGKNYVSQFWKRITEMNFTEFINSRRAEMAERLLLTTDLSMQDVSERCGFSDPKYFYKSFKKWYRCTPSEHRKKYREHYEKLGSSFRDMEIGDLTGGLEKLLTEYYIEEELST